MSKKQYFSYSDLETLIQETGATIQAFHKEQGKIGKMFASEATQDELNELDTIMKEHGIESSSPDEKMSREDQKIMEELEKQLSEEDLNRFQFDRASDVVLLLSAHSYIADNASKKSNSPQEIQELQNFAKGSEALAQSIDKVIENKTLDKESTKDNKKNIQKLFSTIANGVEKLYGRLKTGGSKTIDTIKTLGHGLHSAIKSIVNKKTPKEQNRIFSIAIDCTIKEINKLPSNNVNITEVKGKLSEHFLKLQNDYSKIAPEKYKKVFDKWKEKKNANIDKMSMKELYSEVFKLRKGIATQQKKNMIERTKQRQQNGGIRKQPPSKGLSH